MAIGFLNNEPRPLKLDLVTINDKMNKFRVHIFDDKNQTYLTYKWYNVETDGNAYISSIQIAKDQSILRNLIVTYWNKKPTTGNEHTYVKVFK